MMNKGSNHETPTPIDSSFLENCQVVTASQGHEPSYLPSATGHEAASRTTYRPDNSSAENGFYSNSDYDHIQHADPNIRSVQDSLSSATIASTSSNFGSTKVPPEYNGYAAYPSSGDPYGYASTGYPGHYHNYQHQSSHSYNQPVGAYQNTGAPYQPISSFQNTGSYAGPLSTYYNPDDYQTCGSYQTSGYNHQTNLWSGANYSNYSSHTYTNYTPDNAAYGSTTATANSLQYQQQYKQWVDYYNQTEVTCAPGTENTSVPNTSNVGCPILGISSGHQTLNIQPPLPYAPPWRPQSSLSELPPLQPVAVSTDAYSGCWKQGDPASLNHHVNQLSDLQRHCNANVCYDNVQDKQKSQRFDLQCTATQQVSQNQPSPLQTVSSLDTHRVSKLQIPTNPRIASNLPLGIQKMDKDTSTTSAAAKPAYITVSMPNATDKVLSHDASDSILKPGSFPKSLRGYVERALARCKDDDQMAACQAVLKEMITKATADGTLHTKDWDTESIFPVPLADVAKMNGLQNPESISFLPMHKRSPSRRSKSRWEPVVEEKPVEKQEIVNQGAMKFGSWLHSTEKDRKFQGGRSASKDALSKTGLLEQKTANKSAPKPFKRRRFDGSSAVDNGDDSSDSDKEQSLTTYYSGAIALADTPEERKRRQNRSKRFERGQSHRVEGNNFSRKIVGAGNLYARRASVLLLNKFFEDVGSRAVEDIDWDALTVKGTCQEVEKGYLRLTSAPDPATVRPEDVLGKALVVVQNSQKNYLYKCDQLKSIRQDLTVQRIRNELTVKVYETHARLAIEVGDLPEFNQCQSQLKILYAEGIKGCHMEFAAYNLLCALLHSNNKRDILSSMSRLTDEAKKDEAVKHALAVRAAVTSGNYVLFFRLYKTAPNLNTLLMDLYVEKIRYEAVKCMSRSYRPTFPISYLAKVLGFTSPGVIEGSDEKDTPGLEECVEWLKAHGACLIADNGDMQLDTKASSSSLYMPEPEDAVAHGDASLAVNDFLTRASSQPS